MISSLVASLQQHEAVVRALVNSCLRIAFERPPEFDADHLIDLVVDMLVLGLSPR